MKMLLAMLLLFIVSTDQIFASSGVIWSGQQDIKMGPGSSPDWLPSLFIWTLDMDGNGANDLTFGYDQDFTVQSQAGAAVTATPQPPYSILDAVPLSAGTTVDSSSSWGSGAYSMVTWRSIPGVGLVGAGSWAFVTNAYLGVSFTASDGVHYGWVQITSYPDMRAHIHSWAYESQPGVEITTGVVPEPSTWQLCLVGAGLTGVAIWRRRRVVRDYGA